MMARLSIRLGLIALRWRVARLDHRIHTHRHPMNPPVSTATVIGLLVRHGLGIAAGALLADGTLTADQVNTIGGAITGLLVIGWSVWQKKRAAKAAQ